MYLPFHVYSLPIIHFIISNFNKKQAPHKGTPASFGNIFSKKIFALSIVYIVMKMNFKQNSNPITATMISLFLNSPVNTAIKVYAMEPMPIPFAME